ncbi:MAG: VanZ family protein [Nitrospinaceae bacterium]|nr:VanZ family protein [Nitrospinaceae bacterium]NIR53501.1 VanZ family protein [Nitrospinaceae bacterium]NIS83900.1 VanZ family protein [Nitrospinaceae bacterium]NIT80702.1 VanZ family protein [Nitrospinaceae bacterium]NIU43017.1 VanZ family protein [Nitrospinaceae bacterium]
MTTLRYESLWKALGYLYLGVLVIMSLVPAPPPVIEFRWMDKVLHVLAYALLMLWFAQLYPRSRYGILVVAFIVLGILLEYLQSLTGYRKGDWADVAANSFGTLLSWGMALLGMNTLIHRMETRFLNRKSRA